MFYSEVEINTNKIKKDMKGKDLEDKFILIKKKNQTVHRRESCWHGAKVKVARGDQEDAEQKRRKGQEETSSVSWRWGRRLASIQRVPERVEQKGFFF